MAKGPGRRRALRPRAASRSRDFGSQAGRPAAPARAPHRGGRSTSTDTPTHPGRRPGDLEPNLYKSRDLTSRQSLKNPFARSPIFPRHCSGPTCRRMVVSGRSSPPPECGGRMSRPEPRIGFPIILIPDELGRRIGVRGRSRRVSLMGRYQTESCADARKAASRTGRLHPSLKPARALRFGGNCSHREGDSAWAWRGTRASRHALRPYPPLRTRDRLQGQGARSHVLRDIAATPTLRTRQAVSTTHRGDPDGTTANDRPLRHRRHLRRHVVARQRSRPRLDLAHHDDPRPAAERVTSGTLYDTRPPARSPNHGRQLGIRPGRVDLRPIRDGLRRLRATRWKP